VILACTVLIQITSVTERRTDRRTGGQTLRRWLRRAKHSAVAREKQKAIGVLQKLSLCTRCLCKTVLFSWA